MKTTTSNKNNIFSLAFVLVAFVVVGLVPTMTQGYAVTLITDIMRYAILTVGWLIFSGPTGYMSLATAAFYGIGFYVAAVFNGPVPFAVAIIIAGAAAYVVALLVGALTLRLRGVYFCIFTFALTLLVQQSGIGGRAHRDSDAGPIRRDRDCQCRLLRHVRRGGADDSNRLGGPPLSIWDGAAEHR